MQGIEQICSQLERIAEEISDLALEQLRKAADDPGAARDDPSVVAALAAERRLARARRAVQRASAILAGADRDGD